MSRKPEVAAVLAAICDSTTHYNEGSFQATLCGLPYWEAWRAGRVLRCAALGRILPKIRSDETEWTCPTCLERFKERG